MSKEWMLHHSHLSFFRDPFGAVPCKERVILRLKVWTKKPLHNVSIHLQHKDQTTIKEMQLIEDGPREKVYQGEILSPSRPGLLHYYFMVKDRGKTWYYGNNQEGWGGRGQCSPTPPKPYQMTVYLKNATTPTWWKDAIIYQIYVDRFVPPEEIKDPKPHSLIHAHWSNIPFYIRDNESSAVVRWDFFGGNLLGVKEKLPYLKEMGVSVIYFNPIFESSSNHKYDTGDYKKIDPMYGDNQLFKEVCEEAREYGISIILDGVFSHTGSDSIYFNKEGTYPSLGAYQSQESPYYSWYRFHHFPHHYESWWGIGTLPNVEEMDPSYLDFLITGEDSVIQQWMKLGVKGWRLDVADELPDDFIRILKEESYGLDRDSILIGEVWEDASNKVSYGETREYLSGQELDSVTNYPFRHILLDFLLGHCNAHHVHKRLMNLCENYPIHYFYSTTNLLGSHDVERILTLLGEAPPEDSFDSDHDRGKYRLNPQKRRLARQRLKLLSLIQMTFPGVPCIYYGDEVGMEGYGDPYCRGTYPWGYEDRDLLEWYRTIIRIRSNHPALSTGSWLSKPFHEDVYGYYRQIKGGVDLFGEKRENGTFLLLFHRGVEREISLSIEVREGERKMMDLLKRESYKVENNTLKVDLKPLEGMILKQEE